MTNKKRRNLYWFTGQAGAGKTELAKMLKYHLELDNHFGYERCVIIDGDDIRLLFQNNDYSMDGRKANVDFVQNLCRFMIKSDIIPIVCMVSPFALQRRFFCEEMGGIEIFVHTTDIRGREQYHIDFYELPMIDNIISFDLDTTGKNKQQSFNELWVKIYG
jgi:adenylylsulfate kinase-like enzyme